jgi:hypothetical protein
MIALPFLADGSMGSVSETVTGVDGGFALRLPEGTAETLLIVMPLGFGLTVQRVEGVDPVEVKAAPAEGVVRLAAPNQAETGEVGLLLVGGEPVDTDLLRRWAHLHGEAPTAPDGPFARDRPATALPPCRSACARSASRPADERLHARAPRAPSTPPCTIPAGPLAGAAASPRGLLAPRSGKGLGFAAGCL